MHGRQVALDVLEGPVLVHDLLLDVVVDTSHGHPEDVPARGHLRLRVEPVEVLAEDAGAIAGVEVGGDGVPVVEGLEPAERRLDVQDAVVVRVPAGQGTRPGRAALRERRVEAGERDALVREEALHVRHLLDVVDRRVVQHHHDHVGRLGAGLGEAARSTAVRADRRSGHQERDSEGDDAQRTARQGGHGTPIRGRAVTTCPHVGARGARGRHRKPMVGRIVSLSPHLSGCVVSRRRARRAAPSRDGTHCRRSPPARLARARARSSTSAYAGSVARLCSWYGSASRSKSSSNAGVSGPAGSG